MGVVSCVPGMALYLTGESPEGGQDSDKPIAETKGVLREAEIGWIRLRNKSKSDAIAEPDTVDEADRWRER